MLGLVSSIFVYSLSFCYSQIAYAEIKIKKKKSLESIRKNILMLPEFCKVFLAYEILKANLKRETCNLCIFHSISTGVEAENRDLTL